MNGNGFTSHVAGITWAGEALNRTVPFPGTQQIGNESGANAPLRIINTDSGYLLTKLHPFQTFYKNS